MRRSYADYGLTDRKAKELLKECHAGKHSAQVRSAAHKAAPQIETYILLSITKNLSYEGLQVLWELREIERMPCCRTDFYWHRLHALAILNNMLEGKKKV